MDQHRTHRFDAVQILVDEIELVRLGSLDEAKIAGEFDTKVVPRGARRLASSRNRVEHREGPLERLEGEADFTTAAAAGLMPETPRSSAWNSPSPRAVRS